MDLGRGRVMRFVQSRSKSKGSMMAGSNNNNNNRKRPYQVLLLLLAVGAAVLSVVVLHKLRERRVFGLMLQDRDRQLLAIQHILQREREKSKELKRKLGDTKAETMSLRTDKLDLANKLMEIEAESTSLKEKEREREISLEEKQNRINMLGQKEVESIEANLKVAALTELLKQKEAELEETKKQLIIKLSPQENGTLEDKTITEGTAIKNPKEDTTSQSRQLERSTDSSEERVVTETRNADNATKKAGNQQVENRKEGQWLAVKTNMDDDGLKHENQSAVPYQDTEHRERIDEIDQGNNLEAPKDGESKKQENPQLDNEQQVIPAGMKETTKVEGGEVKPGRDIRTRSKRRRRKVLRRGKAQEKSTSESLEIYQNGNTYNNRVRVDKKEEIVSDGQSKIPENGQVVKGLTIEDKGSDKIANMGAGEQNQIDNQSRSENVAGDSNELDDKEKLTNSGTSKMEIPEGSQDATNLRAGNDSDSDGAEETGASLQGNEGDGFNKNKAELTDGNSDKSEKPLYGKYRSDENNGDPVTEEQGQREEEKASTADTLASDQETEARGITTDNQSQILVGTNGTDNSSNNDENPSNEGREITEAGAISNNESKG